MSIFQKVTDILKKKGPSPLEIMLEEATSDEIWQVPHSQLQEIADKTFSEEDFRVIMDFVWKKLKLYGVAIRSTEKTLILLDYLIKNGAPRCYSDAKLEIEIVRGLVAFEWMENGIEKGKNIRDRAETLAKLLADDRRIEFERENARKLREQLKNLSFSNASLPSHLRPANDHLTNVPIQKKGALSALEEFLEEGRKVLRNQFSGEAELEARARDEIYNGDGEYDLETMPEVVQQQEKEWPQARKTQKSAYETRETQKYSYDTKENSSPTRDDRKEVFDRYAAEIFDTKPTDTNGFGGFMKTKSEILAENAKEVKKKWEKLESDFLDFNPKQENASAQPLADFADFSSYSSTTEPRRRPRIFDDVEAKPKQGPVFEEWWDDPKNKGVSQRKENSLPGYPATKVNPLYTVNSSSIGRNPNAFESKPNPTDWLSSNPFEDKARDNLMDF